MHDNRKKLWNGVSGRQGVKQVGGAHLLVPPPDVCRHQRGRRDYGSHDGHPYHGDTLANKRPRLDTTAMVAEQFEDYAELLADLAITEIAKVKAGQLRRAHVTHEGDVLVETTQGKIELHKKAA